MTLALFIVTCSTALYYLASRAKLTQPLWSRYPSWLEYWTLCAACSGLWYGLGAGAALGYWLDWWFDPAYPVVNMALGAVLGLVWTPVLGAVMVRGWTDLAEVDDYDDDDDEDDGGA